LTAKVAASATIALVILVPAAAAQAPPDLPSIPTLPHTDVERFKMTIHGSQYSFFSFAVTLSPSGDCRFHSEGQISEDWEFARGKAVVMEFTKLPGGLVMLRRVGRPPGDAAFAAPGGVKRQASGFYDFGPDPCGGIRNFGDEPACNEEYKVNSDLRLLWLRGRLTLDRGATRLVENPAEACGEAVGNIHLFTFPYPLVSKQRVNLSKRQIFGHKRGFRLVLKDRFLAPLREPIYEAVEEKLTGESVITLTRVRN